MARSERVITGEAIISYPHLVEPQEPLNQGDKPKYGCVLIFQDEAEIKRLKKIAIEVAKEAWGAKKGPEVMRNQKNPTFRTDVESKGYPEGSTFFSARGLNKPGVVSQVPDKDGQPSVIPDKDIPEVVYPGAVVKASINFYSYDAKGNKGIGVGLNNIQFVRDGDRLDSVVAASDEFEADPEAVADLSDLEGESQDEDADELAELGI